MEFKPGQKIDHVLGQTLYYNMNPVSFVSGGFLKSHITVYRFKVRNTVTSLGGPRLLIQSKELIEVIRTLSKLLNGERLLHVGRSPKCMKSRNGGEISLGRHWLQLENKKLPCCWIYLRHRVPLVRHRLYRPWLVLSFYTNGTFLFFVVHRIVWNPKYRRLNLVSLTRSSNG